MQHHLGEDVIGLVRITHPTPNQAPHRESVIMLSNQLAVAVIGAGAI
jgi:hypothetical protein